MAIDYKELIPEHFFESQMSIDYINTVGTLLDTHKDSVRDLINMISVRNVSSTYLQRLANLINLSIFGVGAYSEYQLRRQLEQAVDWYKIKGTYQSLIDVAYLFDFTIQIKDYYTTDYSTFTPVDWYVGDTGTNPSGLDSSYYKSPHFGVNFVLNEEKTYDVPPSSVNLTYLWDGDNFTNFKEYVENIRPINTVPHYILSMSPKTGIDFNTQIELGNIQTAAIIDFSGSNIKFNEKDVNTVIDNSDDQVISNAIRDVIVSEDKLYDFNDGSFFNFGSDATLNAVTKWKLGTGNVGVDPSTFGFALENIALTGDVDSIVISGTTAVYTILVPISAAQNGLTELGLYLNDDTTLAIACTFPDIDKTTDTELLITVTLNLA